MSTIGELGASLARQTAAAHPAQDPDAPTANPAPNGRPACVADSVTNTDPRMEAGVPAHNDRHVLPTFVEHGRDGVYELDPYSKLLSERVVFLGTPVDDVSANDIVVQLLCLESDAPERDISLYLNSPGGSVTAMMAIYDTMQFVAPDIETV